MGFIADALGLNNSVSTSAPGSNITPWQNQQQQLASLLMGQANGTSGPNPAQIQFQQNANQIAQQTATSNANNRALNPAAAARLSQNAAVNSGQNAAATAAAQQAQQQLASQQLLGTTLAQAIQGQNTASGIQAGIGAGNQQQTGNLVGGIFNAAGSALGLAGKAKGGVVKPLAFGGALDDSQMVNGGASGSSFSDPSGESIQTPSQAPQKRAPFTGFSGMENANPVSALEGMMALGRYKSGGKVSFRNPFVELHEKISNHKAFSHGGKVPTMVSPGELYVKPAQAKAVADRGANPMSVGEKIPGKASVRGDSYKNDTVRKNLDEGGVVVPRSVMESKNPEKAAAKFIADHIRANKKQSPDKEEFLSALNKSIKGRKAA